MQFHLIQHVSFEGPAAIEAWLKNNHHTLTRTNFFQGDPLPGLDDFDVLIVMGGPMGVDDVDQYPWLIEERQFIKKSIQKNKPILGICLGAQMIARACDARVIKNKHREIGWFDISIIDDKLPDIIKDVFPEKMKVFHWHGDTFDIPEGAVNFASSDACNHQGYILNDRVIGLQFHIETTDSSAKLLVENCRNELDSSMYVQSETEILDDPARFNKINQVLSRLLEKLAGE